MLEGYAQLQDVQLILVYNKKPDLLKKKQIEDDGKNAKKHKTVFNRNEIREINTMWTECPFHQDMLDKFFEKDKLQKKSKLVQSFHLDVNDKYEGAKVFQAMINEIDKVQKEKLKAELKK